MPAPISDGQGAGGDPVRQARAAVLIMALGGGALFLVVLIASIRQSPGIGGVLSGLALGLFAALLFGGVVSAFVIARRTPAEGAPVLDDAQVSTLLDPLKPVLDELEATRIDIQRQVRARARWRVPLCAGLAFAGWAYGQFGDEPGGIFDGLLAVVGGGFGGYLWASTKLGDLYRRTYKERVLPRLAARYGPITYRPSPSPDMDRLRAEHIFRTFDTVVAEDELAGTYRGLAISIIELTLTTGSGDDEQTSFDGLLVELTLPRWLNGTTAVIADGGMFGNLRDWMMKGARQRIRLEDPRFEGRYEVWGTDQITARALLTPAFMERFLALEALPGFGKSLALARDSRLMLALPKSRNINYFEPPSYRKPAASRQAILQLDRDISALLAVADAVIDLDFASRAEAAQFGAAGEG